MNCATNNKKGKKMIKNLVPKSFLWSKQYMNLYSV